MNEEMPKLVRERQPPSPNFVVAVYKSHPSILKEQAACISCVGAEVHRMCPKAKLGYNVVDSDNRRRCPKPKVGPNPNCKQFCRLRRCRLIPRAIKDYFRGHPVRRQVLNEFDVMGEFGQQNVDLRISCV